jgi:hypothetical protein
LNDAQGVESLSDQPGWSQLFYFPLITFGQAECVGDSTHDKQRPYLQILKNGCSGRVAQAAPEIPGSFGKTQRSRLIATNVMSVTDNSQGLRGGVAVADGGEFG